MPDTMTSLNRFRAAFRFDKLDRLPIHTFGGWDETYLRWRKEGLPADWWCSNFFGEDAIGDTGVHLGTNGFSPFFPRFESKILVETANYTVFTDEHGRTIRQKKGEVNVSIAEYLRFPVTCREDWEHIKERMDPDYPGRYTELDAAAKAAGGIGGHDCPILQAISGTYRILWHLMGDMEMGYLLHDDPELIHDIMGTWLNMNIKTIDRIMQKIDINILTIMEDMSCNRGMMISP